MPSEVQLEHTEVGTLLVVPCRQPDWLQAVMASVAVSEATREKYAGLLDEDGITLCLPEIIGQFQVAVQAELEGVVLSPPTLYKEFTLTR